MGRHELEVFIYRLVCAICCVLKVHRRIPAVFPGMSNPWGPPQYQILPWWLSW